MSLKSVGEKLMAINPSRGRNRQYVLDLRYLERAIKGWMGYATLRYLVKVTEKQAEGPVAVTHSTLQALYLVNLFNQIHRDLLTARFLITSDFEAIHGFLTSPVHLTHMN